MAKVIREAWSHFEDPVNILINIRAAIYSWWLRSIYSFDSTGRKLSIHYPCSMRRKTAKHIRIGNDVIIGKDCTIYVVIDDIPGVKLHIDDNIAIGARSTISTKNRIHIERDVIMGTSVLLQDHQHTHDATGMPIRDQGITAGGRIHIEQGCWIGQGAAIICNEGDLVIGRNSVVGANAVVGRSVPPYSVIVGNPGIVVKRIDPASIRDAGGSPEPRITHANDQTSSRFEALATK